MLTIISDENKCIVVDYCKGLSTSVMNSVLFKHFTLITLGMNLNFTTGVLYLPYPNIDKQTLSTGR